jgi:arylsulfatase A-like enzyme
MQGRDLLDKNYQPRQFVFAARDRCDETVEHLRSVRSMRYKYIRNYLNERPHLQPNRYKDSKDIVQRLREMHAAGELNELQQRLLFSPTRPKEELYDLASDPHELHNLAADPDHQATLALMREQLAAWEKTTNDQGRQPEPAAMYDSDMAVYLGGPRRANTPDVQILRQNIELMKRWAAEGR